MKILWLPFLILCIYLSQVNYLLFLLLNSPVRNFLASFIRIKICSSIELSDEDINNEVKRLRDSIYGVSDQFVDDVKAILDKFRNYSMIIEWLPESLVSKTSVFHLGWTNNNMSLEFNRFCFWKMLYFIQV